MSILDEFRQTIGSWRTEAVIDEDEVAAPHNAVDSFDLAAFATEGDRLRSGVRVLDAVLGDLDAAADGALDGWHGRGGQGLAAATGRIAEGVSALRDDLADQAQTWSLAHAVLVSVLHEYQLVMTQVIAPVDPGESVQPRLELAAAAGAVAATAIDDVTDVVNGSDGELVLAGDR